MTGPNVVFYDYDHCREFLDQHSKHLQASAAGLGMFALYREFFYSFSSEALETNCLTLGQFDRGIVYLFVPKGLEKEHNPRGHEVARAKALEMMQCGHPPMVLELISANNMEPAINPRSRIDGWMKSEFLNGIIAERQVQIHLYFNASAFLEEAVRPQLEERGFIVCDPYPACARSGVIRVRHPNAPGKIYKLPWLQWTREMMTGGYSVVYMVACLNTYLAKMEQAVAGGQ